MRSTLEGSYVTAIPLMLDKGEHFLASIFDFESSDTMTELIGESYGTH